MLYIFFPGEERIRSREGSSHNGVREITQGNQTWCIDLFFLF